MICRICQNDKEIPDGQEHTALLQYRGVWLCSFHLDLHHQWLEQFWAGEWPADNLLSKAVFLRLHF